MSTEHPDQGHPDLEHPDLEHPPDHPRSRRAVIWDAVMSVLALASLVPILWVEIMGLHWPHPRFKLLAAIDLVFVAIFAAELTRGLWRSKDRGAYLKRRWFEVPGLVPLYLDAFALLRIAQVLRLLRLLRLLRTVRALRRTRMLRMLDLLLNRHKLLHTPLITAVVVVVALASVCAVATDATKARTRAIVAARMVL